MSIKSAKTPERNSTRRCFQRIFGLPVEVWWGLEWVKTTATQLNESTILAKLVNREGNNCHCKIRNSKGVKMWRHLNK
jgi:hypothetical protein